MSLDLTGLTAYTDENKLALIRQSILGGKTLSLINLQADIKSSASINILESDAVFQAGACGWNASGTTTLSQRVITVSAVKQNEALCQDDLEAFYTQKMLKAGSYNEDLGGIEGLYAEEKAARSAAAVEQLVWNGDTAGAGNLVMTDGLIKLIDAEGAVVTGTILALDAANIVDAIDEMVAAMPTNVIEATDNTLFIGYEKYRLYIQQLRNANLFHNDAQEGDFTYMIHGTNVKMVAVSGLNSTNRIFLAEASNLFAGTDLLNDQEDFRIFFSEDNDEVRFKQKFKIGFQMAFPARIVSN